MGGDGKVGSMVGEDVYGVVLGYYDNDYSPVKATTQPFELAYAGSLFAGASNGLYNGNIRNATVALRSHLYYDDTDVSMNPIGYAYTYDQLNRYVKMRAYNNYDTATNEWQSGGAALRDYAEDVTYDGNGNIESYIRHGNPTVGTPLGVSAAMDSLTYSYNAHNNQLNSVADAVPETNYNKLDIDNEVANNYTYDKNGEMIFDSSHHLVITWNVRNKVNTVYNDSTKLLITFGYDAMGNRVMKRDSNLNSGKCYTQWYERDAQGNVLSMYKERHDSMWWQECDIYGSSRVGVYYPDSLIYPKGTQVSSNDTFTMELWEGKRQYELTNHLGNVLTTVSDKKIPAKYVVQLTGRDSYDTVSSYQPEVISISDLYPYGGQMPGRTYSLSDDSSFAYGFNGKYKDDDIEGKGNALDFDARENDIRRGQWWTTDPDKEKYPGWSPYNAFFDNPLYFIDPRGNGGKVSVLQDDKGQTYVKVTTTVYVYSDVIDDADLALEARKMQDNINQQANSPAAVDDKGNVKTDKDGNPIHTVPTTRLYTKGGGEVKVVFDITVTPISVPDAQNMAAHNKAQDVNFVRLYHGDNNVSGSFFVGNVGAIDLTENQGRNYTSFIHEIIDHNLAFRQIFQSDNPTSATFKLNGQTFDNTHAAFIPGQNFPSSAASGHMSLQDLQNRIFNTNDLTHLNFDQGIGSVGTVNGQGTFGEPNQNVIFSNGAEQKKFHSKIGNIQ